MTLSNEEIRVKERLQIVDISNRARDIMLKVNEERGNAASSIGLLGLFLELRTMYLRLRGLVWDSGPPLAAYIGHNTIPGKKAHWVKAVRNALQDLRNYTVLAEMALLDDNLMRGPNADGELSDPVEAIKTYTGLISNGK